MPAPEPTSIEIRVTPPDAPDVKYLVVYESANPTGPFVEVWNTDVSALDPIPDSFDVPISSVALATDWFAVQWQDSDGSWITPLSPPVKAGAFSFVELVIDRVLQRDRTLGTDVVRQEVEVAIERYFNKNPYSVTLADIPDGSQYSVISGLVYLSMARSYLVLSVGSKDVQSATLGLVSFRTESGTERKVDVELLLAQANALLGISTSLVLQIEDLYPERWWVVNEP